MGQLSSKAEEVSDGLILRIAAREGHTDGRTAVHDACEAGQSSILKQLLATLRLSAASNTFDPVQRMLDLQDSKGMTALAYAATSGTPGHLHCTASLLQAGSSVWLQDKQGCTCLHHAAVAGNSQAINMLLPAAATHEQQVLLQMSPQRQVQCSTSNTATCRFVNIADTAGRTALHYAVQSGHLETIHMLITAGACLTATALYDSLDCVPVNRGATPLHLAAIKGNTAVAVLLLTAYVAAAAGALPELTQARDSVSHCEEEQQEEASSTPALHGRNCSCWNSDADGWLQDPRVLRDCYGMTPHAVAPTGAEQYYLRQLLNPSTVIADALQALPGGRSSRASSATGAQETLAEHCSDNRVAHSYQQLVRAISNAGGYLTQQRALQEMQTDEQ